MCLARRTGRKLGASPTFISCRPTAVWRARGSSPSPRIATRRARTGRAPAAGAARNQIFVMRPDGGEAKRVTDARDGVSNFSFSKDGKALVYTSGRAGDDQIYALNV